MESVTQSVKQFASFIILTSEFKTFSKSFLKGLLFNQLELAFCTKPVSLDEKPGSAIPTVAELLETFLKASTNFFTVEIPES